MKEFGDGVSDASKANIGKDACSWKFVVQTWRLGSSEKGFLSTLARVDGKNRKRWGWFADELLSQCYSVWTLLQSVFYGLRLLSAARAFWVDYHIELVGVSLEEGVWPARRRARRTASRRVETAQQSVGHENVMV